MNLKKYESTDSKFQLINIAAKRCRQLRSGYSPKIQYTRSKNSARIALEEVKTGKVLFEPLPVPSRKSVDNTEGVPVAL